MKPNLLIVQPQSAESDSIIDQFCETLSNTHYVYLIRPMNGFRDDSPAGVRFLPFSPDRFPGFGAVEGVILLGTAEIEGRLKHEYPAAQVSRWNVEADGDLPFHLVPSLSETIIHGDFGHAVEESEPLARAM